MGFHTPVNIRIRPPSRLQTLCIYALRYDCLGISDRLLLYLLQVLHRDRPFAR
jgi:hypothetical protein